MNIPEETEGAIVAIIIAVFTLVSYVQMLRFLVEIVGWVKSR